MMPAEYAAAIAVPETLYIKIAESMKFMSVHDSVVTTIGRAIFRTSRAPAGRDHQDSVSVSIPCFMGLSCISGIRWQSLKKLYHRAHRDHREEQIIVALTRFRISSMISVFSLVRALARGN